MRMALLIPYERPAVGKTSLLSQLTNSHCRIESESTSSSIANCHLRSLRLGSALSASMRST